MHINDGDKIGSGRHLVTIKACEEGTSTAGNPTWVIDFEDSEGKTQRDWAGNDKGRGLLMALGMYEGPSDYDSKSVVGKQVFIDVEPQDWGDGPAPRVARYLPANSGASQQGQQTQQAAQGGQGDSAF